MLSGTAWLCSCAFPQSLTPVSPHSLGTAASAVLLATVHVSVTYLAVTQCCGWLRKRIVPNVLHPCPLRPFPRHFSTGRTGSQLTPHPFPPSPGPPPTKTAPHSRPTPTLSHFQHSMPATAAWIHTEPAPTRSVATAKNSLPAFFSSSFFRPRFLPVWEQAEGDVLCGPRPNRAAIPYANPDSGVSASPAQPSPAPSTGTPSSCPRCTTSQRRPPKLRPAFSGRETILQRHFTTLSLTEPH